MRQRLDSLYSLFDSLESQGIVQDSIVLRLADAFDATAFRARFEGKGRLSEYLRPIPTFIIEAPNPGLIGAATAVLG